MSTSLKGGCQQQQQPSHYIGFHTVTSGNNGSDLGSDESDIVVLIFVVVDAKTKQVSPCPEPRILFTTVQFSSLRKKPDTTHFHLISLCTSWQIIHFLPCHAMH